MFKIKSLKYVLLSLAMFTLIGCGSDFTNPKELGALPDISTVDATVTVDQATNMVTFTYNNTNSQPLWNFGEDKTSTSTNFTMLYAKKGEYSVELKMMDYNGISAEAKTFTFTMDKTYVDEALVKALCGEDASKTWRWDNETYGHLGCGPSDNPEGIGWYTATANDKAATGMYDDRFTFHRDGTYTYNPGADANLLVNAGVTLPEFVSYLITEKIDYDVPATEQTSTWEVVQEGNDSYVVLKAKTFMGYLAYNAMYEEPKFKISTLEDNLIVFIAVGPGINWRYQFVSGE